MNREWLLQLANDIEERYGNEDRNRLFNDIDSMGHNSESLSEWFENFTTELDKLNDKEFLQQMMANRCPCGGDYETDGMAMRNHYDQSNTLEEFVESNRKWMLDKYGDTDIMELRDNVLYMTKPLSDCTDSGSCGKGCHCWLAMHTNNAVSNIFCHCCTIGHTGRPFQVAFGKDIMMEFVESIICGGKACVMMVHLPEKELEIL